MRNRGFKTPSKSSPRNGRRGCLCPDGTYSTKCCDGSLQAQGIGRITALPTEDYLAKEDSNLILQEDNFKIKI
jgi:hypothetical protein